MRRLFSFCFLFFSVFVLCLTGCRKSQEVVFSFPSEDTLFYVPDTKWAVIIEPVAALYEDADYESNVQTHARRGDILEVCGKRLENEYEDNVPVTKVWYGFGNGWLEEESVVLYDNKRRAESASKKLLEH